MVIEENVPLASLTTFGIGGDARFLVTVNGVEELQEALEFAKKKELQVLLLGGGSNMLIPDAGWAGLVIKIEIKGVELAKNILIAGAGESWDGLVERAVAQNVWGIENLSGIPGTVGGAVVQNIGAYGAALSQTLQWVEVYDTKADTESDTAKKIIKMSNAECAFGYRDSFFKHTAGRYVVLRAAFVLSSTPQPDVSYKDLAARFAGSSPSLVAIRAAVLEIRKDKFPDLTQEGTAGSFFKNPIVSNRAAQALKERYPGLPIFTMPETEGVKVPLAWFLDSSHGVLDMRELHEGGARLFEKQPLVIVAQKNTLASDVVLLAQKVKKEVKEKLHLDIEEEVKII
jgi:UDP-N-acetylmuramate dehydrogenase